MSKAPHISGRKLVKAFEKIGYRAVRQCGSHIRLYPNGAGKRKITIPDHRSIGTGLLYKILRDAELSIDDLTRLL